eukprot:2807960-Rhodomonas_salina.3
MCTHVTTSHGHITCLVAEVRKRGLSGDSSPTAFAPGTNAPLFQYRHPHPSTGIPMTICLGAWQARHTSVQTDLWSRKRYSGVQVSRVQGPVSMV